MAPEPGVHPSQAALLKVDIQGVKALEGRHRYQEVAADVADHPLHLVIALARATEPVLEQVVGLQLGEGTGPLTTTVPQDPGHRQPGVVVQNALGRPAQKGEGRHVAVQERLGGLRRIGLHEGRGLHLLRRRRAQDGKLLFGG